MEIRLAVFSALQRCRIKTINYGSNEAFCFYWEQLPLHAPPPPPGASCWAPPPPPPQWGDWEQNWALAHTDFLITRCVPLVWNASILLLLLLFLLFLLLHLLLTAGLPPLLSWSRCCDVITLASSSYKQLIFSFASLNLFQSFLSFTSFVVLFHLFFQSHWNLPQHQYKMDINIDIDMANPNLKWSFDSPLPRQPRPSSASPSPSSYPLHYSHS